MWIVDLWICGFVNSPRAMTNDVGRPGGYKLLQNELILPALSSSLVIATTAFPATTTHICNAIPMNFSPCKRPVSICACVCSHRSTTDQPPPDVPSTDPPEVSTKSKPKSKRPWFTRDPSSYNASSYQSGGTVSDPTAVPQAYTNDPESAAFLGSAAGGGALENDRANAWESRFGWRVDVMAAAAYLGGPVTGAWDAVSLRTRWLRTRC